MLVKIKQKSFIEKATKTQAKIVMAILMATRPLTISEISRSTKLAKQLITYHIPILINQGILIPINDGKPRYSLQPFLMDQQLFNDITDMFKPIMVKVGDSLKFDFVDEKQLAFRKNLQILSELFTISLDE